MSNGIKAVLGVVEIIAGAVIDYVTAGTGGNWLIGMGVAQMATYAIALLLDPRKSPLMPIGAAYAGLEVSFRKEGHRPLSPARAALFERGCRTHVIGEKTAKIYPRFQATGDFIGPFQTIGSCMWPYVRHGSLVWADGRLDVRTDEIVLARDRRNGKIFCKLLERIDGRHVLTSTNERAQLPAGRFEVIGPAVMIVTPSGSEARGPLPEWHEFHAGAARLPAGRLYG
jgi:hypothetical protein